MLAREAIWGNSCKRDKNENSDKSQQKKGNQFTLSGRNIMT